MQKRSLRKRWCISPAIREGFGGHRLHQLSVSSCADRPNRLDRTIENCESLAPGRAGQQGASRRPGRSGGRIDGKPRSTRLGQ
jgi:hypothetical protein